METQGKSVIQILQELIGIHTMRKEVCERLQAKEVNGILKTRLSTGLEQSNQFLKELMSELAEFGDAVTSEVNRQNEYNEIWNKALPNIETISSANATTLYDNLEASLRKTYEEIIHSENELPVSLNQLITAQAQKLGT